MKSFCQWKLLLSVAIDNVKNGGGGTGWENDGRSKGQYYKVDVLTKFMTKNQSASFYSVGITSLEQL